LIAHSFKRLFALRVSLQISCHYKESQVVKEDEGMLDSPVRLLPSMWKRLEYLNVSLLLGAQSHVSQSWMWRSCIAVDFTKSTFFIGYYSVGFVGCILVRNKIRLSFQIEIKSFVTLIPFPCIFYIQRWLA
jgi:hypothetical protein